LDLSEFPTRHNYGLGLWQNHIERILAGWVRELRIRSDNRKGNEDEGARKKAYLAVLRSVVLHELGRGIRTTDLERRWKLEGLEGIEERWRDSHLWLLAGLAEILDLRCFYFHLREDCSADAYRIRRVKGLLKRMRDQAYRLQDHLKYCSPLGPVLQEIRQATNAANGASVGVRSIRRLEEAGVRSLEDLAQLGEEDLIRLGVRRDLAMQIRAYVRQAS
jgi:helicase